MTVDAARSAYPRLFRPLAIGPVEVPNRIVRSAHGTGMAQPTISPDLIAYHLRRAEDGVGLTVLEAATPHGSSPAPAGIDASTDIVVDGYSRLAEAIRPTGMKLFQQLQHAGAHRNPPDGSPAWAPSEVISVMSGRMPLAMSTAQIDELLDAFATAAERAERGGLDGIEIQACHGYLLEQFLSPLTNRREDEWGGDAEGRRRFVAAVLRACRERTGPGFSVGVRIGATESVDGGIVPDEALATREALEAAGLIDFVSVSIGSRYSYPKIIGAMHEPTGYELSLTGPICEGAGVPTIVGGRLTTLAEAERLVAAGVADLISLVRATIADDRLIRKSVTGRGAEVRRCIACNHGCLAGLRDSPPRLGCAIAPEVGHELAVSTRSPVGSRAAGAPRLVVVGGGPAGIEAALVGARSGFSVLLLEAADELGGQLALARRAPLRGLIGAYPDWAGAELARLDAEIRLGTEARVETVIAERPDAVVLATGAVPVPVATIGSSWDVLGAAAATPDNAVVHDGLGHYEAIAVVDTLVARGTKVTFLTDFERVGPAIAPSLSAEPAAERFAAAGVQVETGVSVDRLGQEEAELLVAVAPKQPRVELIDDLREALDFVVPAGEVSAPGYLREAVYAGHRAGTEVLSHFPDRQTHD